MKYKLIEIETISKRKYKGQVTDLSVLDDNSYTVYKKCVHNCGCLTTVQTGIGYPMASLINECREIRYYSQHHPKIVADGGFKNTQILLKRLHLVLIMLCLVPFSIKH